MAPSYDYECEKCKGYFSDLVPMSEYQKPQPCPKCGTSCGRIWLEPPMVRHGGEGSDRQIASMKKSFKNRFVKKELDDLRHRFGNNLDESFVSAAAGKIKEGKDPNE